jgi:hypothetical protein
VQEPAASNNGRSIDGPYRSGPRAVRRRAHTGLGLLIAGPLLGLLLVGALSLATINEVKVGGPQDDRVTQAHALVADTTLPSQNLTALEGTLLRLGTATTKADVANLRTQVDQDELRYREGHAYWDTHLTDPVLRDSLLVEAHEPVATLFRLVHERLWPAMDRGDRTGANVIVHDQLVPLLDRHQQAMEHVSAQASESLEATSDRAADAIALRTRMFAAVLAAVMVLVAIAAVAAMRLTRRAEDHPTEAPAAIEQVTPVDEEPGTGEPPAAIDAPHDEPALAPTLESALGTPLETDLGPAIELTH